MAQETRVEAQIAEGRRFIESLVAEGVEVTGAAWVRESEGSLWYFSLATPLATEDGRTMAAYGRVNEVMHGLSEPLMLEPLQKRVVSPGSPVGKAWSEYPKRPKTPALVHGGSGRLGDRSIDEAIVSTRIPAAVR